MHEMARLMRLAGANPRPMARTIEGMQSLGSPGEQQEGDDEAEWITEDVELDHEGGSQAAAAAHGVLKAGWLGKRGGRFYDVWKRRYFVLQPGLLSWWTSRESWLEEESPRNTTTLHRSQVVRYANESCYLVLLSDERTLQLRAHAKDCGGQSSQAARCAEGWASALRSEMDNISAPSQLPLRSSKSSASYKLRHEACNETFPTPAHRAALQHREGLPVTNEPSPAKEENLTGPLPDPQGSNLIVSDLEGGFICPVCMNCFPEQKGMLRCLEQHNMAMT